MNPTKLELASVQDQDDLTVTLAPQHMEKVHKNDSSDSEYRVEKVPSYKLKMGVRTVKKRKYKILGENREIDEIPTDRDAIMGNSTHGDSALDDNVKYEPHEHHTSLSDVPQLTTQVQTSPNTDGEEDAKLTSCPHMGLEAEQFPQPTTQQPVEQ